VVDVEDTGGGVPSTVRERVFDRFYRGGRDADDRGQRAAQLVSGAGLGLAIARWIAEAHGGTLTLARSDASGSDFRLTLPASPAAGRAEDGDQSRLATLPSSSSAIHAAS